MKYLDNKPMNFSMPGSKAGTDEDYEVKVGIRCPDCREKLEADHSCGDPRPAKSIREVRKRSGRQNMKVPKGE